MCLGVRDPRRNGATGRTIGFLIAAVVVLAVFVGLELRSTAPLVPFGIFRLRTLTA